SSGRTSPFFQILSADRRDLPCQGQCAHLGAHSSFLETTKIAGMGLGPPSASSRTNERFFQAAIAAGIESPSRNRFPASHDQPFPHLVFRAHATPGRYTDLLRRPSGKPASGFPNG